MGALEDMRGKKATYYSDIEYSLHIPKVGDYKFMGVLNFESDDRTIMFEYGDGFGVSRNEVLEYLKKYEVEYNEIND